MSAMADRIAAEHALRWHQPSLLAACSNPDCKMPVVVLRSRSDLWPAEARHIAEVTEAAVLASVKPSRGDARKRAYADRRTPIHPEDAWAFEQGVQAGVDAILDRLPGRSEPEVREQMTAEDLIETRAGLALANASWQEGAATMLRSVNEHSGGTWTRPVSPYSAPLLARIAREGGQR